MVTCYISFREGVFNLELICGFQMLSEPFGIVCKTVDFFYLGTVSSQRSLDFQGVHNLPPKLAATLYSWMFRDFRKTVDRASPHSSNINLFRLTVI